MTTTTPPTGTYETGALTRELLSLSHSVIEQELERLARKAPSLTEGELQLVTVTLHELVDRELVTRARVLPHREEQLRDLFGFPSSA